MEPQPGDLVEIFRAGYQHWGVYVGEGDIVHLVNPTNLSSSAGSQSIHSSWICRAQVMKEKLEDVVGKDKWKINNNWDTTYKPHPTQQIVKDADSFVGEKVLYSVHLKNCEHFATKLRYGKPMSWQVTKAVTAAGAAAAGAAAAGAVLAGPAGAVAGAGAGAGAHIVSLLAKQCEGSASMSTSSS